MEGIQSTSGGEVALFLRNRAVLLHSNNVTTDSMDIAIASHLTKGTRAQTPVDGKNDLVI